MWEAGAMALVRDLRYGSICAVPEIFPDPGVVLSTGLRATVPGLRTGERFREHREVGG